MKKVVLAFSGGLDTTYCAIYLSKDLGYEVHALTVNTGGFSEKEHQELEQKAIKLGVASYKMIDASEDYYDQGLKYLIFGNVLKNNTYPLSVSAERIFQAIAIANYANEIQADAIAHGSTGAGNDQVRFDMTFHTLCPDMEIITPIRDLSLTRQVEIEYLTNHGVEGDWTKSAYSINQGLWGTSIGGKETLSSSLGLPEEAFLHRCEKTDPTQLTITFKNGEPVALDGQKMEAVALIQLLDTMAHDYAIGRDIHVGDTIIGIKGRVGFEAGGPMILVKAHHLLEKHTLSKQQLFIKDQLAAWYGQMMHDGQMLDPVMRDIESFLESSQHHVSGDVYVSLLPYRFELTGIESSYDLMGDKVSQYGEETSGWSGEEARGFAKILANQTKIYQKVTKLNEN
jgi:argininosuccinate synthase